MYFGFLFDILCQLLIGASSLAGLGIVPPFHFRVGVCLFVSPHRHDIGMREGFDARFPILSACVLVQFAFLRLAAPRHAGGTQEGFDGGLS